MLVSPDQISFLQNLAPPQPDWGGTGAVPLTPDARDFRMEMIPAVGAVLSIGAPPAFDLRPHVKGVYHQGAIPSCVAHSTCGMKSIQDHIEHGDWVTYDADGLYREMGGTGTAGVDPRGTLERAREKGIQLQGQTRRYRIGSYAFAPQVAGAFEETLKAAVAAMQPCTLALLLPQQFGWNSGGPITQGYHQVCVVGYDAAHAIILNSWGDMWGERGLGRIPWSFITQQNFQNGFAFAYTVVDALDPDWVRVDGGPVPTPPPPVLAVTGYGGSTSTVNSLPAFVPGGSLEVQGRGFDIGVVEATLQPDGIPLALSSRTGTQLVVRVPDVAQAREGWIRVRREGAIVEGPRLMIVPRGGTNGGGGRPTGDLLVNVWTLPVGRGLVFVRATVSDATGNPVSATVSGTAGGTELVEQPFQGGIAHWMARRVETGSAITVRARAADGRQGTGTAVA